MMNQITQYKHVSIDVSKATKEEIQKEIARLEFLRQDYGNKNTALKVGLLNSAYGVAGFKRFVAYHKVVAQSITKQSEDLIKYTIKIFNDYFEKYWPKDKKVHEALGITRAEPVKDIINYADTDSVFGVLDRLFKTCDYSGDKTDFLLKLHQLRLDGYIEAAMKNYIDHYGGFHTKGDNMPALSLQLEEIDYSVLWVAKKMYIKNPTWSKKIRYPNDFKNLKYKGLAMNKGSHPEFVRKMLKETTSKIFEMYHNTGKIDAKPLLAILSQVREKFRLAPNPEDICQILRIGDYDKNVVKDTDEIIFSSGIEWHVKSAAYHNYLLYNNNLIGKYQAITTGDRLHCYYTKDSEFEVFGYLPYEYPHEIAPKIDYDRQFENLFLSPLNSVLESVGIKNLNSRLEIIPSATDLL